jgi:hypothetical protein
MSDELFREILLKMRVELKSEKTFLSTLKVLHSILKNILSNPTELKY